MPPQARKPGMLGRYPRRPRSVVTMLLSAVVLLPAACSAASSTNEAGASSGTGSTGTGGAMPLDAGGGGDGGSAPDCSEASKLIYVLSQENGLYSFSPPSLTFQKIGTLSCPAPAGTSPFSMAVDRSGTAWTLFDDGSMYHVEITTAACSGTPFVSNQPAFSKFGMGFMTDAPGSPSETLYASGFDGSQLGKIDTGSLMLSVAGSYDQIFNPAELTGTGAARLFGFFTTSPPIVAEIDPGSAKILSQAPQPSVDIGSAWAFAFWGGDFYLFTSPGISSRVDRYRPSDGTTITLKSAVGFHIVGAGVSTCAPTEIPR